MNILMFLVSKVSSPCQFAKKNLHFFQSNAISCLLRFIQGLFYVAETCTTILKCTYIYKKQFQLINTRNAFYGSFQYKLPTIRSYKKNNLFRSPAKVVTLEYGKFVSQYPDHSFITPQAGQVTYRVYVYHSVYRSVSGSFILHSSGRSGHLQSVNHSVYLDHSFITRRAVQVTC